MGFKLGVVGLLALTGLVSGDRAVVQTVTDEHTKMVQWFDTLGFDAVRTGQFVQIERTWTGYPTRYEWGFVEKKEGERTLVFYLSTHRAWFPKKIAYLDEKVTVTPFDIKDYVPRFLAAIKFGQPDRIWAYGWDDEHSYAEAMVLTRALEARDFPALAKKVYAAMGQFLATDKYTQDKSLEAAIKASMGVSSFQAIVESVDDKEQSRAGLQKRFEWFASSFPNSDYAPEAKVAAAKYAAMAKEDAEHDARSDMPLDSLPLEGQVEELVFQLRDAYGTQNSVPGFPSFLSDGEGDSYNDPIALKLVKIGIPAVPRLIDALDDERYTRARTLGRFGSVGWPVSVSDVAYQILCRIANRPFYTKPGAKDKQAQNDAVKKLVRQWLDEVQTKGERTVLIESVTGGGRECVAQAGRLVAAYPAEAVATIRKALPKVENAYDGYKLIALLGVVNTDEAYQLAKEVMLRDKDEDARVAAAEVVAKRDPGAALDAMLADLRLFEKDFDMDLLGGGLMTFLVKSGEPRAIDALQEKLDKAPLLLLDYLTNELFALWEEPDEGHTIDPAKQAASMRSAERLLVRLLPHNEHTTGYSSSSRSVAGKMVTLINATVRDNAMIALADGWPAKYKYRTMSSEFEKEALSVTYANIWRAEQHMPLLPLPKRFQVAPAASSTIRPLLDRALTSVQGTTRSSAIKKIEALGLPALDAVIRAINDSRASDPGRSELESLANRLSCIVTRVDVTGSTKDMKAFVAAAQALKGKSLTTQSWFVVLQAAAPKTEDGYRAFRFTVDRDNDGSGLKVTVVCSLFSPYPHGQQWDNTTKVSLEQDILAGSSGSGTIEYTFGKPGLEDVLPAVHKVLVSDPLKVFKIDFEVYNFKG